MKVASMTMTCNLERSFVCEALQVYGNNLPQEEEPSAFLGGESLRLGTLQIPFCCTEK